MSRTHPRMTAILLVLLLGWAAAACSKQIKEAEVRSSLSAKIVRYVPTTITADIAGLQAGDRQALPKLIEAGRVMDDIYLRQVWAGNPHLLEQLERETTPAGLERLHYFRINFGPWSLLDHNDPFIHDVPSRPKGASFYPEDMTVEEFENWVATLPPAGQERARGFFWVVRRDADRALQIVPYSREYREELEKAAVLLKQAAALTENDSLRRYLTLRAEAFLSNDYYASDVAWMEVDAPLDVTIGPYETYTDELLGYKAAFEAFITLRDEGETRDLARYGSYLQQLEDNLPIDPKYRNPKIGALAPIRVVNEVFVGGDSKAGVQTAAFNLPNDPRVTKEKGSKRVMLKNVQEAKFQSVLTPISKILLDPAQLPLVSFQPFFTHIVAHELVHGLGPHDIRVAGRETTVRRELKDLYSAIEEAKADITGLWALGFLIDKGKVDREMERPLYSTSLASSFRSVRFGINEAHGKGVALQFNYLRDESAFERDPGSGRFRVNFEKIRPAIEKLTARILTIEAQGDYAAAKEMLDKYGVIRPDMQEALDKLRDVPVDIEPVYALALRRP